MVLVSKFESPADEYASLSDLDLHELIVGHQKHAIFFAFASGDNLQSVGIFDSDLMVANRAVDAEQGDVVIAAVNGEFVARIYDARNNRLICDSASAVCLLDEGVDIEAVVVQSVRCLRKLLI